jgi:hypothetical protein
MLTQIENKLEDLFASIEGMPADKVEHAEKVNPPPTVHDVQIQDKERRQRLRLEKLDQQRVQQEERIQKALQRAQAPVKKKAGKPVHTRMLPPQKKKKQVTETATRTSQEDLAFFLQD